ncbi:hypothetical protein KJ365_02985 [Glaciecola sp. XM2]|jgi:hypothetical protein|uniref:hypothetical protein n=1 Tax=Glaciecola sp. XM2 TaxID=1914931 RepID=UPI001BDE02E5|nr:hypothetical protein [Glaciecola sp. XM2]MBT1449832.1 hypothetical protein [Glaciecola sp. XM2]
MEAKTPWWFWLVAVLAIFWNSGGVMDFTMTHTHNEAYMSAYTQEQRDFFYGFPLWANIVWALGVFGGFIGAVLLLFRTKFAFHAFAISIFGMVVSFAYQFTAGMPSDLHTPGTMAFTAAIWIIAGLLMWFTVVMQTRGILK